MEAFLQSTTAHGLPRLGGQKHRIFWIFICISAYILAICSILSLVQKYFDPKNLKTFVSAEMATATPGANKTLNVPHTFPRFVLCAPDPKMDIRTYQNVEIEYVLPGKIFLTRKLPPFRLHYLESKRNSPNVDQRFRNLAMCSRMLIDTLKITIRWNGVNDSLDVYLSIDPDEPFLRRIMNNGQNVELQISSAVKRQKIGVFDISIYKFYAGKYSNFTSEYPSSIRPYQRSYYQYHCQDMASLKVANDTCRSRYLQVFDSLFLTNRSGDKWKNVADFGCKFDRVKLVCPCKSKERLDSEAGKICKMDHMSVHYNIMNITSYHKSVGSKTIVVLKKRNFRIVTTSQIHAMRLDELFSQMGGFLGLLVGASLITVAEFFELLFVLMKSIMCRSSKVQGN